MIETEGYITQKHRRKWWKNQGLSHDCIQTNRMVCCLSPENPKTLTPSVTLGRNSLSFSVRVPLTFSSSSRDLDGDHEPSTSFKGSLFFIYICIGKKSRNGIISMLCNFFDWSIDFPAFPISHAKCTSAVRAKKRGFSWELFDQRLKSKIGEIQKDIIPLLSAIPSHPWSAPTSSA